MAKEVKKDISKQKEEIQSKGKAVEQKIKAAIDEPDIKKLEQAYNESQGLGTASTNIQEHEPVNYKAGEFVNNNSSEISGSTSNPADELVIDEGELYKVPEMIDEPLMGNTIDRGYSKNPAGVTQPSPQPAAGGSGNQPPGTPPISTEPVLPETPPIQPTVVAHSNPNPGGPAYGPAQPGASPASGPAKTPPPPNEEDLSPSQKRKNAEKTADSLLIAYQNILPLLPKWMASFNIPKWQRAEMRGEINLKKVVNDEGLRVIDYLQSVNSHVEATYIVTKEMVEEVKGPLIDVLLEKNYALTPTERLLIAIAQQAGLFIMSAGKQWQQNSAALAQFKEFHEQDKKAGKVDAPPTTPTQPIETVNTAQQSNTPQAEPVNNATSVSNNPDSEQKVNHQDSMKLDELLKGQTKEDILTEGKDFELIEYNAED
jgi:hypothetical protein